MKNTSQIASELFIVCSVSSPFLRLTQPLLPLKNMSRTFIVSPFLECSSKLRRHFSGGRKTKSIFILRPLFGPAETNEKTGHERLQEKGLEMN